MGEPVRRELASRLDLVSDQSVTKVAAASLAISPSTFGGTGAGYSSVKPERQRADLSSDTENLVNKALTAFMKADPMMQWHLIRA